MTDIQLETKIEDLKKRIRSWAKIHNLWHDTGFKTWSEYFNDEPEENPCVLVMWSEGPLCNVLNFDGSSHLCDDFFELIESTDFEFDMYDHGIAVFYAKEKTLKDHYKDYFEWRWICELITPDYSDLYEEIFKRFVKNPEDLHKLNPRKFELLLDAIFRNAGYTTELGPGQGDGGVDLRLYSNDVIGEAVTLVQARRYAKTHPIRLEAVQALSAAVEDERANRGLFITMSRFLPSVQRFAVRQNRRIKLAAIEDIQRWSKYVANRIIRDKSTLISKSHVRSVLEGKARKGLIGKIFHASTGYNIVDNKFVVVLKETKGATLLMTLPTVITSDDGYGQRGYHVPILDGSSLKNLQKDHVFRAKKNYKDSDEISLWGNREYYTLWDGKPQYFDHCD